MTRSKLRLQVGPTFISGAHGAGAFILKPAFDDDMRESWPSACIAFECVNLNYVNYTFIAESPSQVNRKTHATLTCEKMDHIKHIFSVSNAI